MNVFKRGIRNAFRNGIRTFSIVIILGLSLALALSMLLAHQAVGQKIASVKGSVGNTINISPAGYNPLSQANNALTTNSLGRVKSLAHVTSVTETLTDRLSTIGSSQPEGPFGNSSGGNNQTSLMSPITLNSNGNGSFSSGDGGQSLFISGGGSLPANFSPPIQILGTNNPSRLQNDSSATIKSGKLIDGSKDTNNAMVSTDMASKNNLSVGSTFTAYGATLTVAGIFDSGTRGGNDVIVVSLPALERLSGQGNVVSDATATVDSIDNLDSTTTAIKNALGSSADVTNGQTTTQSTIDSLDNVKNISLYSLVGAAIAGAAIIFLTMMIIVRERRREIGVLKAIGASNIKVVGQFMAEAVTLTVLAAVIGILIGIVAADPITRTLVNNSNNTSNAGSGAGGTGFVTKQFAGGGPEVSISGGGVGPTIIGRRGLGRIGNDLTNIHANAGWGIIGYGLGAALLIALVGSGIASWAISKVRPAEVMRTE